MGIFFISSSLSPEAVLCTKVIWCQLLAVGTTVQLSGTVLASICKALCSIPIIAKKLISCFIVYLSPELEIRYSHTWWPTFTIPTLRMLRPEGSVLYHLELYSKTVSWTITIITLVIVRSELQRNIALATYLKLSCLVTILPFSLSSFTHYLVLLARMIDNRANTKYLFQSRNDFKCITCIRSCESSYHPWL